MAVKLYTKDNAKLEKMNPYYLILEEDEDNIVVFANNFNNGESIPLLSFKPDGTIYLQEFITPESGFNVTKTGKLVVSNVEYVE